MSYVLIIIMRWFQIRLNSASVCVTTRTWFRPSSHNTAHWWWISIKTSSVCHNICSNFYLRLSRQPIWPRLPADESAEIFDPLRNKWIECNVIFFHYQKQHRLNLDVVWITLNCSDQRSVRAGRVKPWSDSLWTRTVRNHKASAMNCFLSLFFF